MFMKIVNVMELIDDHVDECLRLRDIILSQKADYSDELDVTELAKLEALYLAKYAEYRSLVRARKHVTPRTSLAVCSDMVGVC